FRPRPLPRPLDLLTLELRLDNFEKSFLIMILERSRIKRLALLLNQLLCKLKLILVDVGLGGNVSEMLFGFAHFIGIAERRHHDPVAAAANGDDALLAA